MLRTRIYRGGLDRLVELHDRTRHGARIQVAEQYPYQPMHAARLALVDSGRLGRVSQAQVSAAHGYHGLALLRRLLNIGYEDVTIRASRFTSPLVAKPRNAALCQNVGDAETIRESRQTLAHLDFGDRLGVYDFTGDQYTSWIRGPRVLVRGDRGEIINDDVKFLADARTPVEFALRRIDAGHDGNLEGYHHKGVIGGETWLYPNAFVPGRLSDEELAVATCLAQMGRYALGGDAFYPVAEAAQDVYLAQLIEQAVETGEAMCSDRQSWAQ